MNKQQIIVAVLALSLVFILFNLPRVVVENEKEAELETHDFSVSDADGEAIQTLRQRLYDGNSGNSLIFADSLTKLYLKYGYADSAYRIAEAFLLGDSSLEALMITAPLMYSLYERAMTPEQAQLYGSQASRLLKRKQELEPENLSIKTKLAMTLVTTERPMAGIEMLRGVLETNPEFREAIINLGLLSIRSGQYKKAKARFEKAIELKQDDYEAMLFLGICQMELGEQDSATIWFEKLQVAEDVDPAIKAAAIEYLDID